MKYLIILAFSLSFHLSFGQEKPKVADRGNSTYRNPIISGRFADPTVCKVGEDYYMTHSMGGTPSLLIWHSQDLVNWKPIGHAAIKDYGSPWAPDLTYINGMFYIYVTFVGDKMTGSHSFENVVLTAKNPAGPWSEPINLGLKGLIDPGHIQAKDGKRYLYFNKGRVVELDAAGTKVTSKLDTVYTGWPYPKEWITECFCLESPKINFKDGWYYMTSAQGGTTGPSTSHMAVVARSKSPLGPWENSPLNPLIKTRHRSERWWSQGHATLIEAPDNTWYAIYHGYENGYRPLGRQTLMVPITWTADGWPIANNDLAADGYYPVPKGGKKLECGMTLSDGFDTKIGIQWREIDGSGNFKVKEQQLHVIDNENKDKKIGCFPTHHAYEARVEMKIPTKGQAGIMLYKDPSHLAGISFENGEVKALSGSRARQSIPYEGDIIHFKIKNLHNDVAIYFSANGEEWIKMDLGMEISSFNSSPITLFANDTADGVYFDNFQYFGLD